MRIMAAMEMPLSLPARTGRRSSIALGLVMAAILTTASPYPVAAAESSPTAQPAATTAPTLAPADALCQSADDLRLIVGFLRETDPSEDGWVPVIVGAIAGLSEARQLLALVDETYRPLVDDLATSFRDLRSTVEGLSEQTTAGAGIASLGEAITTVGNAMDALSVQLREPCPASE